MRYSHPGRRRWSCSGAESGEDVINELIITNWRAGDSHGVGEGLHLVHVLSREHLLLPQRLKLTPDVTDVGATLRAVHGTDGRPYRPRCLAADELTGDVLLHGGEK